MYDIMEETSYEAIKECVLLGRDHYNEVEEKANTIPYNINYSMLKAMTEAGLIVAVTVRDSGRLVGYMANLVGEDFFNSRLEAKELGIYLAPEARGGRTFIQMMKKTEECMASRGVVTQYLMFKEGHDVGLAQRLGYEKTETVYQKHLVG